MWLPVRQLLTVLRSVRARLSEKQRRRYLERLSDPEKHEDVLAEFLPIVRLVDSIPVDFEWPTGVGGHDVEWRVRPRGERPVLVEVKKRMRDLLEAMDRLESGERDPDGSAPAPTHDVSLLFRSVEKKFSACDPDRQLQGAWIHTELKQEGSELEAAFNALDPAKVHFAILGGWESGVTLLTRRPGDREYLLRLFGEQDGDHFRFVRGGGSG